MRMPMPTGVTRFSKNWVKLQLKIENQMLPMNQISAPTLQSLYSEFVENEGEKFIKATIFRINVKMTG